MFSHRNRLFASSRPRQAGRRHRAGARAGGGLRPGLCHG